MQKKSKTNLEKEDEGQIRALVKVIEQAGISVRREKLTRGQSFRVKSGDCVLSDRPTLFVDRNLPIQQQLTVLIDYIVDNGVCVSPEVAQELPAQTQAMLSIAPSQVVVAN